jgi:hypothetical protein
MTHDALALTQVRRGSDGAGAASLPFSAVVDRTDQVHLAQRLVETLDLTMTGARIHFAVGDGAEGLRLERLFRLRWWREGADPMRSAMHRAKIAIYSCARSTGQWAALTAAWRLAERQVRSAQWRGHWRELTGHAAACDKAYLRLAFRIAQQAWSRAARFHAIMPAGLASPFAPLIELLEKGALPLGFARGALWIFLWHGSTGLGSGQPKAVEEAPAAGKPRSKQVFLSALFRDAALAERWKLALRDQGWQALHGPVDEDLAPPEVQLAKRIRDTCAAVGLIDLPDADFGLPWWMYQELDYASACGRPVALVSGADQVESGLRGVFSLCPLSTPGQGVFPGPAVWRWLDENALPPSGD